MLSAISEEHSVVEEVCTASFPNFICTDTFLFLIHTTCDIRNLTDINYEIAWQYLCERYDNHIKSLFEMEAIEEDFVFKLRGLIDTVVKPGGVFVNSVLY